MLIVNFKTTIPNERTGFLTEEGNWKKTSNVRMT